MARPRLAIRILFFVIYGLVLSMGISAKRGWLDWQRISHQNEEMEDKIVKATRQRMELIAEIDSLLHNRDEQERMVRQVLGYIRPNEAVIEFQ